MPAVGLPPEMSRDGRRSGGGGEGGVAVVQIENSARGGQCYRRGVGIVAHHIEDQLGAGHHAGVVDSGDGGRLVLAAEDGDLHIAHHGADADAVAPLADEDGDVVLPLLDGRVPDEVAGDGVDGDGVGGGGQGVAGDVLAIVTAAGDEAVAETVAVGIESTGVVVVGIAETAVVDGRVQQLR